MRIMFWCGNETFFFSRFLRYHMRRTAGSLVLHSMLPIGELRDYHRSTVVPVIVYFLIYAYLSVAMDHSHPTLASFWQVRTEHISTPLHYIIHTYISKCTLFEGKSLVLSIYSYLASSTNNSAHPSLVSSQHFTFNYSL